MNKFIALGSDTLMRSDTIPIFKKLVIALLDIQVTKEDLQYLLRPLVLVQKLSKNTLPLIKIRKVMIIKLVYYHMNLKQW